MFLILVPWLYVEEMNIKGNSGTTKQKNQESSQKTIFLLNKMFDKHDKIVTIETYLNVIIIFSLYFLHKLYLLKVHPKTEMKDNF